MNGHNFCVKGSYESSRSGKKRCFESVSLVSVFAILAISSAAFVGSLWVFVNKFLIPDQAGLEPSRAIFKLSLFAAWLALCPALVSGVEIFLRWCGIEGGINGIDRIADFLEHCFNKWYGFVVWLNFRRPIRRETAGIGLMWPIIFLALPSLYLYHIIQGNREGVADDLELFMIASVFFPLAMIYMWVVSWFRGRMGEFDVAGPTTGIENK